MSNWSEVTKNAISRYNNRYDKLGKDVKSLGWGSAEQQRYRFEQVLTATNFSNKNVLDIGCGFSDFLTYAIERKTDLAKYTGWDVNEKFLNENKSLESDTVSFANQDIANLADRKIPDLLKENHQISLMLGLLNFKLGDGEKNYEYSFDIIKNAFKITTEVLVVDFLSSKLTLEYPKEDLVFYHDPSVVLDFALNLTPNVVLKHDYAPIPQKEFMLFLYK
ncbi:methyltransferase [Leptospira sp. 201903071]|uniref:SAM-dependent methyltransferase n=1 Tax=Leptospira ainazelensis TaxID=2810034 RepID=UPI001964CB55|nr:class I SAM-dependent methyltransferase [Leptospira ainazelensis]MBM9501962.1 methyltransferase [Leptospira ainazelensis]